MENTLGHLKRVTFIFINLQCLFKRFSLLLNISSHFEEVKLLIAHAHILWTVSPGTVVVAPLIHCRIPFPGSYGLARSRRGRLSIGWRWSCAHCWHSRWIGSCSSTQFLLDCIYQRVPKTTQRFTIHSTCHIEVYCQVYIILHMKKKDGGCTFTTIPREPARCPHG